MNCLILGGGSKFGAVFVQTLLKLEHKVYAISSNEQGLGPDHNLVWRFLDWQTVNMRDLPRITKDLPDLDLILFNQNATALGAKSFRTGMQKQQDWAQAYFVSCQLPFYLCHALKQKISATTRVVWMLSNLINQQDHAPEHASSPDYIGNKYTNLCIMKAFAHHAVGCYLGIVPSKEIGRGDHAADGDLADRMIRYLLASPVDQLKGQILPTSIM